MAVLFVTPGFAANEQDDTCIPPLQALVQALVERGFEVLVVALEYPFTQTPYTFHGAKVFPCNGRNRKWRRWYTHHLAQKLIFQLIDQHAVRIIFSFWLTQAWSLVNRIAPTLPHYTVLMGQDVLWQNNRRYLKHLPPQYAARLIAVSPFQAAQLLQQTGIWPALMIPWGVDIPPHQPTLRPIDILGVGALLPVKNWKLWLECVADIVHVQPETRAILIGGGPLAQELRQYAHQIGVARQVEFVGHLPRKKVLEYMTQSKVLLHTAHFESFGYVLAEARARQCAVVSTPVGIAPECGWTFSDRRQLTAQIQLVLAGFPGSGLKPFTLTTHRTVDQYVSLILRHDKIGALQEK